MTTQETTEPKKRGRKAKTLAEQIERPVKITQDENPPIEVVTKKPLKDTLAAHLERVELLRDRRTDKEAKALLTGLAMGLKAALRQGVLVERSGRFYLETGTDEA